MRVHLLFLHKTWRKEIASLPGYQKSFQWVGTFNTGVDFKLPTPTTPSALSGVQMPSPDLAVLPSVPFPNIPAVASTDFASLLGVIPRSDRPLRRRPCPIRTILVTFANFMLANADFFSTGWTPGSAADPWQGITPRPREVQAALNHVTSTMTYFSIVPPACAVIPVPPPSVTH